MIRLIKPYIQYDEVESELRRVFESGIFTRGENVEQFSIELSAYTGAKHAFLLTSATTALWSCLRLLGVGSGDEVVVSDFSFPATANVVEDVGARPVFADVSMETFNMLPEELERKINPKTKAVIFVDAFGSPDGLGEIKNICGRYGVPLIEDAACAIGSSERGIKCGRIADLTCFSFHPRKLLNTGEGGAITCENDEWAHRLRVKLSHGGVPKGGKWEFPSFGYNFRLSEVQAVLGRAQLRKLDWIVQARGKTRDVYRSLLEPMGFVAQHVKEDVTHNVQSVVFRVPELVERDALIAYLSSSGIEATIGTYCLSGTEYFRGRYSDVQRNASQLEASCITLPCFDGVNVELVCEEVKEFLRSNVIRARSDGDMSFSPRSS